MLCARSIHRLACKSAASLCFVTALSNLGSLTQGANPHTAVQGATMLAMKVCVINNFFQLIFPVGAVIAASQNNSIVLYGCAAACLSPDLLLVVAQSMLSASCSYSSHMCRRQVPRMAGHTLVQSSLFAAAAIRSAAGENLVNCGIGTACCRPLKHTHWHYLR